MVKNMQESLATMQRPQTSCRSEHCLQTNNIHVPSYKWSISVTKLQKDKQLQSLKHPWKLSIAHNYKLKHLWPMYRWLVQDCSTSSALEMELL